MTAAVRLCECGQPVDPKRCTVCRDCANRKRRENDDERRFDVLDRTYTRLKVYALLERAGYPAQRG